MIFILLLRSLLQIANLHMIRELKVKTTENINTIDDVKNLDIPLIYETKNIKSDEEIMATEKPKNKIKIAFLYYSIQANGIGRFIAVTSNNLIKTGKYDIYFITEKPPSNSEFAYDPRIKSNTSI